MLILAHYQFIEPLCRDVVEMDSTSHHRLNTLELAYILLAYTCMLANKLTCNERINRLLEVLVVICQTTLCCDLL